MIEDIREWHKRNKDLVNTFILVLIAIYTYYEINISKEYNYKYLLGVVQQQQMQLEECYNSKDINFTDISHYVIGD